MSAFTDALVDAATSDRGITTGPPRAPARMRWSEVHAIARRGAAVLTAAGIRPGSAVAILAGQPIDVAPAAQAAWLAGASVTMVHQPTARTDLARYAADTFAVLAMIDARVVIVGAPFDEAADMLTGRGLVVVTMDELRAGEQAAASVEVPEGATALLQLTSGSTAAPKAVRITHRNLWANITGMVAAAGLDPASDVMVSWLPLFHDMGMVGFLTLPMCRGIELVKVTPADFLAAPLTWLELIDKYRGTVTAAPNFAFALAARALRRAESLDLSTLRFALNGAEPIDVAAVEGFLAAGAPFGLRPTAVVPAYGMAEATLGVSFHPWGTPLEVDTVDARALEEDLRAVPASPSSHDAVPAASGERPTGERPTGEESSGEAAHPSIRRFPLLGPPLPGISVVVRSLDGSDCAAREVGTLMIKGEAVTEQYRTVEGPIPARGADGWLSTGDLGYLTESGAVVVCGRAKDVIIMGGRNIYPTDIERAAQIVDGVRAGNAAAVRIEAGDRRETFAVIVESKLARDTAENARITAAVRSAVTREMGVRPATVLVVPAGTLPKTPSGKIKRAAAASLLAR